MKKTGDILKEDTETAAFVSDALSNALLNPNPMLNQVEINLSRHATDADLTAALEEKQLYELASSQLPLTDRRALER